MRETGEWIKCGACVNGIVMVCWQGFEEADDCVRCNANGRVWRYPSGAIALYEGGPLRGIDPPPRRARAHPHRDTA